MIIVKPAFRIGRPDTPWWKQRFRLSGRVQPLPFQGDGNGFFIKAGGQSRN